MKKLAVFFPGMGYTVDRPLLYYSKRLAEELGYDIKLISFSGFPQVTRGDFEKIRECFDLASSQAKEQLLGLDLKSYKDIVFISKSIGTVAAAEAALESVATDNIRHILFTPLYTFQSEIRRAIAFTGSLDPMGEGVFDCCREKDIPCFVVPNANHSLETGDALLDVQNLKEILAETKRFLTEI